MPDWSYQTIFRPVLFRLPPATARDFTLGCMGVLSRLPLGPALIDFLGHMRPDARLQHTLGGVTFPSRVGLGGSIDPKLLACGALSRFGVAFLEVGPITLHPVAGGPVAREDGAEAFRFHAPRESPGLEATLRRLRGVEQTAVLARLVVESGHTGTAVSEAATILDRLGPGVTGVILQADDPVANVEILKQLVQQARRSGPRVVLLAVSADLDAAALPELAALVVRLCMDGVFVDGAQVDAAGCRMTGRPVFAAVRQAVAAWRAALPPGAGIVAGGGVHEPVDALELIDAGSDLVAIDSGLIFSGPGFVKRINEALLFEQTEGGGRPASGKDVSLVAGPQRVDRQRPAQLSWFWTCLVGISMFAGGVLALVIACTRVVMPYDESMVGLSREQLMAINDRLLHFMTHDRVTLSGTMLSVGILYLALSVCGSRRGMHWAHVAIVASALTGFASFFLFLGFGYFDPFHAFVSAVLLQFTLLAMHCDRPPYASSICPELTNDRAWRRSQWGQLLFIVHGAILVVAGGVISAVGISVVFVPEDLEFMRTTAGQLFDAHPRLVPLIAHDRASFGGMLIACGVCVLLSSLWGFRRGHAWLWWALMLAGSTAYLATILVHWQVGYTSLHHLLPAYGGLGLLFAGGALSRQHLCGGSNGERRRTMTH